MLCQQMNRESNQLLWYWIQGLTDQRLNYRINKIQYEKRTNELEKEVIRLNSNKSDFSSSRKKIGSINFSQKLDLILLRYWNLFESLKYSNSTLSKLKSWHEKGIDQIKVIMLKLGIPLEESKQKFAFLNPEFKKNLDDKILKISSDYDLEDICTMQFNYYIDNRY